MPLKPTLIVIAGPNGAGKTSVTSQLLEHHWVEGCTYINPDNIAQHEFGNWNSEEAVLKAANRAAELREICLAEKRDFVFETVLSSTDKVLFLERAKDAGFFIRLFFVGTNTPIINASRVAQRVSDGGHDVPISKIISRFSKSIANCAVLAATVDRLYVYDNSIDDSSPKLLFRATEGPLEKVYGEVNSWAISILHCLNPTV